MKKWFLPVLCVTFVVLYGTTCWKLGKNVEQQKLEHAIYQKATDSLTVQLVAARTHRDTLVKRVPVEVLRMIHDSAKVETIKFALERDSTTADSLGTAVVIIAVQDTLITAQRGHIKTLTEIVQADSGIARLYVIQRGTDSTRIRVLEKQQRGPTIFGLRLPKVRCVAGVVVVAYPSQAGGLGGSCGLSF